MAISMDEAFANCLASINQGSSIEDCAARFPQYEQELTGLLGIVYTLNKLNQISPAAQFVENASQRLVSKLPDRNTAYRKRPRSAKRRRSFNIRWRFSLPRIAIVVVLVLSAFTVGTALAANKAAPGEPLYGLDLAIEQIRLDLAPNAEAATRIHLKIAAERLEEAQHKLEEDDFDNWNAALDAYESEVAAITELVGNETGFEQEKLTELVAAAFSRNQEVLNNLLSKVPEQAQSGILRALEASSRAKAPSKDGQSKGPPEGITTGKPEDKAKDKSKDKTKGKPDFVQTP